MGIDVKSEIPGSIGRSDMILFLPDKVYAVIELKYREELEKPANKDSAILELPPAVKEFIASLTSCLLKSRF
jgi:hypothetical protein